MPTQIPQEGRDRRSERGRWKASLGRSVRLLRDFAHEQEDPGRFYTAMAEDSVGQLRRCVDLDGSVLLDVGGGRGWFREAFEDAGATYLTLDVDHAEVAAGGGAGSGAVVASGTALPVRSDSVDVCYSANVLEHVRDPWRMADEMVRVTRAGGTVFLSYTLWWGPWGGHETAPWHYLGGHRARRHYVRTHGRPPKNSYGETLFAVTAAAGLAWARERERSGAVEVLARYPRYNPRWSHWLLRVPGVREVVTWNLVIVLRKR